MGHFVNSDVTSGPTPAVHAGLNYKHAQYTLSETASGSLTISMCNLPAGARVADCTLGVDNNALALGAAPGTLTAYVSTGGTKHATLIQSASGNAVIHTYNPDYAAIGYRATSSSQVRLSFHNMPASGTTTTVLDLVVAYDCQEDGD